MPITLENILALIPNAETQKKVEKMAITRKWRNLEGNQFAVWGEVKSGGAAYYKTKLATDTNQFHCNCPTRKKPCQHALALMLLFIQNGDSFKMTSDLPEWVEKWLTEKDNEIEFTGRTEEQEQKLAEQRLKTREKRLFQMEEGLRELDLWLNDVIRQGIATLETQPESFWEEIGARLVNAKCGSLARRVRNIPSLIGQDGWHEKVLTEFGELYLLLKGYRNIQHLPAPLQQELLNQAGINYKKDELLVLNGIKDTWMIVGQTESVDDKNLFSRKSWIHGEKTKTNALILDFAYGNNPYEKDWKAGIQFKGEVVFYPSSFPLRVTVKEHQNSAEPFFMTGFPDFISFSKKYAEAVGQNPWLSDFPAFLENVIPVFHQKEFYLIDENKKMLPLENNETANWKMIALSGGNTINIFGIFDGNSFKPLSAIFDDQFILLNDTKPLPRPTRQWGNWG